MANPDLAPGALAKPYAGDAAERKFDRRQARQRAKQDEDRLERQRQAAIRDACYHRDAGRCRAFNKPLKLFTDNPYQMAHCHHLVYRSAGGSDELHNRVTLSPEAHRDGAPAQVADRRRPERRAGVHGSGAGNRPRAEPVGKHVPQRGARSIGGIYGFG